MKRWSIALIGLCLTGCISAAPSSWQSTGGDAFTRASYECKQQVGDQYWRAAAFGGVVVPIVSMSLGPKMFRECMEAQGYTPAK